MSRGIFTITVIVLFLLFSISSVCAEDKKEEIVTQRYYRNSEKEGWWWYKDYVKEKKEEKKKETEQAKEESRKETNPEIKPLTEYTFEELMKMHPDELSKIYDHYLKLAVQNPSEENVYNFYNIQDVVRKKALAFAKVSGYVWQKYPDLTTEKDVPIVGPGIVQTTKLTMNEIQSYIKSVNQDFGLIVFISPTCHYCETQLGILKYAESDGVQIKTVDITKNPQAQVKFGITTTPTIILVDRTTGQYMPISAGVMSLEDIYIRIVRAMKLLRGESPEQYATYEYQKGGGLDVTTPPPLWKDKKVNKGGK